MHRLLKSISLISLLTVTGCTTWEQVDAGVRTFKGQHYKQAIAALGFPDEERKIAGHTVYVWNNESSGSYTVPTSTTATTWVSGMPVYTTVNSTKTNSYHYECELKLVTNSAGTVIEVEVDGNLGGCEHYARYAPKKGNA